MTDASVTTWIQRVRANDPVAAQHLWERYVQRLVQLARSKLGHIRTVADEEDVVVVAFEKFLRAVDQSRFPKLSDRNDLWQILVLLTEQTAVDQIRIQIAEKRGGGEVRGESALWKRNNGSSSQVGMTAVEGREPTPEFAAIAAERYRELLDALEDDELRDITIAKMDGYSNQEIAEQFGIGLRSVERKLNRIRTIWLER